MLELSKLTRISRNKNKNKTLYILKRTPTSPGLKSESTKRMNKADPLKNIFFLIILHWKKPEDLPKKQGLFLKRPLYFNVQVKWTKHWTFCSWQLSHWYKPYQEFSKRFLILRMSSSGWVPQGMPTGKCCIFSKDNSVLCCAVLSCSVISNSLGPQGL